MQDTAGPTAERLSHSNGAFDIGGDRRSGKRYRMLDDALGRVWRRAKISDAEYAALKRYALHWLAGGLAAHLGSVDLNRIYAHDPGTMTGLAKSEKQADHRATFHAASQSIGFRPYFVASRVACQDLSLVEVGIMLGYRSEAHAREHARLILSDAGFRLGQFFRDLDR